MLGVSNTAFRVPAALKTYLRLRDGTCRFPGCNRAARHSDRGHTRDKQFGGPSTAANLYFLCPANHALKHNTRWTPTSSPDGTLHWVSRAGKHYATDPATRIRPPHTTAPPATPPPVKPPPEPANGPIPFPLDPWNSALNPIWDPVWNPVWNPNDPTPDPF